MSAQQNQLQNVTGNEYELFMKKYGQDDVSTEMQTHNVSFGVVSCCIIRCIKTEDAIKSCGKLDALQSVQAVSFRSSFIDLMMMI